MRSLNDIVLASAAVVILIGLLFILVANVPTKYSARTARRNKEKQKQTNQTEDAADERAQLTEARRQRDEYMRLWQEEAKSARLAREAQHHAEFALAQKENACARAGQPCTVFLIQNRKEENANGQ